MPVARREWDRLVGELAPLRLLTNLDRAALAAYCGAYALWAEATEAIQKVWHNGEVAIRLSGAIALRLNRQPAGRNHDADRIRIRIYAGQPKQSFYNSR